MSECPTLQPEPSLCTRGAPASSRNPLRFCALLLALLLVAASSPVRASERSVELTRQGRAQLRDGELEAALESFRAAQEADPEDAQAVFFEGVALNRLGRFRQAYDRFTQAQKSGFEKAELDFELGWAALGSGRAEEAIERLEAYETARPGRGQTSEFLGRAHLAEGNLDRAERYLKRAAKRNPELKPTVELHLAAVEQRRGERGAAAARLRRLAEGPSDSAVSSILRRYGRRPERRAEDGDAKRWRLTLTAGAGWNDNVVAVGDGVPLPADISDRGSAFGDFGLRASYDLLRTRSDRVTVGYAFEGDIFEETLEEADVLDNYWYADWSHRLDEKWATSLRVADQFTHIGGNSFRNRISVRPAVSRRITDWLTGELSYSYAADDYFFSTPPVRDRDGDMHAIGVTGYFRVPETELTGSVSYLHSFHDTEGGDYDRDSDVVSLGLEHPLPFEITGQVSYTHVFDDYDNRNSFTGFATRRDDDIDAVSVQLSRPIPLPSLEDGDVEGEAEVFFRFDYTQNDSNVAVFDYDQEVYSAGVRVSF